MSARSSIWGPGFALWMTFSAPCFSVLFSRIGQATLSAAFEMAHQNIQRYAMDHPQFYGMGTTCTALSIVDRRLHFAHVGDSRLYLIRAESISRLTRDHSVAEEMRAARLHAPIVKAIDDLCIVLGAFRLDAQTSDEAYVTGVKARHVCAATKIAKDLAGALAKERSED